MRRVPITVAVIILFALTMLIEKRTFELVFNSDLPDWVKYILLK